MEKISLRMKLFVIADLKPFSSSELNMILLKLFILIFVL